MHSDGSLISPAFMIALALAAGIVAQSIARHIRLPGIVILIAAGIVLGPDVAGVLRPEELGKALPILVEFAVAVILFEGGLNLNWRRLKREGATIRRLVTLGAVITAAGGFAAARLILSWDVRLSVLFGTLVVVTGPTVITPLLRRIKVNHKLSTILEAEGVFIDAVGAILAIVALEVVLSPSSTSIASGVVGLPSRLAFGAVAGLAGGFVLMLLLRIRGVIPEGMENIFTLSLVLALFQASETFMSETGIVATIVAGLVVGNSKIVAQRELREFKEQLTVLFIGMLFVLLAADVRINDVLRLGWPAVWVVVALMLVVRPINVAACTVNSDMGWRDRAFLAWLAPRGIVAAAIASLFYDRLGAQGFGGGADLRALVFLVIAVTVVVQGGTGPLVARWLRVRRPSGQGYAILGAHLLGRTLARILAASGEAVVLIDSNPEASQAAESDGFRVVFGNALDERVGLTAEIESRKGVIGALSNEAVNILFAEKARDEYKVPRAWIAVPPGIATIGDDMVEASGARVLFGEDTDIEMWAVRLRRGLAKVQLWEKTSRVEGEDEGDGEKRNSITTDGEAKNTLLALTVTRDETTVPTDGETRISPGDRVHWLVLEEGADKWKPWLEAGGWTRIDGNP